MIAKSLRKHNYQAHLKKASELSLVQIPKNKKIREKFSRHFLQHKNLIFFIFLRNCLSKLFKRTSSSRENILSIFGDSPEKMFISIFKKPTVT